MWFGALLTLLTFAGVATASAPPPGNWTLLSTWLITADVDTQTIPVGAGRGQFDRMYLKGGILPLNVRDIKVTYADGKTEDIQVRATVPPGGSSRVLELKGTDRRLASVTVTFDKLSAGSMAVSLYGQAI
jgi:hypothetical protein